MMANKKIENDVEYIFIPDGDGNEEKFEIIYEFEAEGKNYILLVPADTEYEDEEDEEVYAFRYEEDDKGDLTLFPIEDDAEWDMVEETFHTLEAEFADEIDEED